MPGRVQPLPFTYSVDHRRQQVNAVGTGIVTVADFATYIAARVKDGVYDYDQVIDLSAAQLDAFPREVINAVKQARTHLRQKPIPFTAIVATPGNVTYGLARQLATLFGFEGATVQVVDSAAAANEWLDKMKSEREKGPLTERQR